MSVPKKKSCRKRNSIASMRTILWDARWRNWRAERGDAPCSDKTLRIGGHEVSALSITPAFILVSLLLRYIK